MNNMKERFVAYFIAGYPDASRSLDYLRLGAQEGVDIFEIGYPSANPLFDGDSIRKAHEQVTDRGTPDMDYWKSLRAGLDKPIWVMAYKADFIDTGIYRDFARQGLMDNLVLPDCDDAERRTIKAELEPSGVEVMGFANTEMTETQFRGILEHYRLVYFQRYLGKTGSAVEGTGDVSVYHKIAKEYPQCKLYAGFGIRTAEKTRQLLGQGFDGIIIGTALVEALNESEKALVDFIRDIAAAVKN